MKHTRIIIVGFLFLVSIENTAHSQSLWLRYPKLHSLSLEYFSPSFKSDGLFSRIKGTTVFLTGRFNLSNVIAGVLELPYANGSYEAAMYSVSGSSSSLGNPYVGLEYYSQSAPFFGEFGIRLPVFNKNEMLAGLTGIYSDLDRWEAFIPEAFTVSTYGNFAARSESGVYTRLRVGPSFWISTKSSGDASEALLGYSARVGYASESFDLAMIGFGKMILTEGGEVNKRTYHQLAFSLGLNIGIVRPDIQYRIVLDEYLKHVVSNIIGVSLNVALP
jgi:hypothetical protein